MKWPWNKDDEREKEESKRRHPSWNANQQIKDQALVRRGTWHDWTYYERKD